MRAKTLEGHIWAAIGMSSSFETVGRRMLKPETKYSWHYIMSE